MSNGISLLRIDSLEFDSENPRLPLSIRKKKAKDVIDWMLLDASLLDLVSSIAQNGFFGGEPLLVTEISPGKYTVIEGNRRLAACIILNSPNISKTKSNAIQEILNETNSNKIPQVVPCIVFSTKDEVIDYLGYRHVTGVQSWGPLAKARYLDLLYSRTNLKGSLTETCQTLAKKIGSKTNIVKQLLVGYWLYQIMEEEGFFSIKGLEEETIEFSHLYDSLKHKGIRDFLNVDFDKANPVNKVSLNNYEEFSNWLYNKTEGHTRLGDSRNLKILNKVVSSKEALKSFREGKTLEEASRYSDFPEEMLTEHVLKALSSLKLAIESVSKIEKCPESVVDDVRQIRKLSKMLHDSLEDDF